MMGQKIKAHASTIVIGIFFIIAAIFLMVPFSFMFLSSLKPAPKSCVWA